jgi:hypothetical protein
MAILLAFLINLTLTSFISCFILKLNIKNESIKDMNINKKIYKREVARQVFIFSYQNTNTISSQVISLLGDWS